MLFITRDAARIQNAVDFIKSLPLGKLFSIEVKAYRKNRSTAQNRTYWMWLNAMSPDLGYSPDDLHEVFKERFLGLEEKTVSISKNGHVLRSVMVRPKSTASLTVGEFADYLRKVETLAAMMGIQLVYPDDYRFAMNGN